MQNFGYVGRIVWVGASQRLQMISAELKKLQQLRTFCKMNLKKKNFAETRCSLFREIRWRKKREQLLERERVSKKEHRERESEREREQELGRREGRESQRLRWRESEQD